MSRISLYANNEIKFNLLAVVPDKLEKAIELEKDLEERKNYLQSILTGGDLNMTDEKFKEYNKMSKEDILMYVTLAFLTIIFTYFNYELRKQIKGDYKQTRNK